MTRSRFFECGLHPTNDKRWFLNTTWKKPRGLGSGAYENEGHDRNEALRRIRQMLDAEFSDPADQPTEI
jgi:hypothetical protein